MRKRHPATLLSEDKSLNLKQTPSCFQHEGFVVDNRFQISNLENGEGFGCSNQVIRGLRRPIIIKQYSQ
jgi:hypothetical protein